MILLVAAGLYAGPSSAHALYPATQTVQTLGSHGWASLKALNGRTDVTHFIIEVFDDDTWKPSTNAVATPDRIIVPAHRQGEPPVARTVRVLVRLAGARERKVMVCTKSVAQPGLPSEMVVNSRVCSRITVKGVY